MTDELAIHGGKPVRQKILPYGRQWLDEADSEAVLEVLKGDFLTTGPMLERFEQAVAAYVGAKYGVAFANGTAALHGAAYAAGINRGDEVITSPMTFVASANCILYQGGIPVFADIDPSTGNIDPKAIEKVITSRSKALIPVDYTGRPVDIDRIMQIAHKHDLVVIEDAAHAFGATYKGTRVGSQADMTMFSFHPVKHITTGEGGMITTNSRVYYQRLIKFRSHGITKERSKVKNYEGPWYYEMQDLGYNYRLTDIQAALGLSQLEKSEKFLEQRRSLVQLYREHLGGEKGVILPLEEPDKQPSWHLFIIQIELEQLRVERKEVFEALQAENIGVNVHYIPVYRQPYYQELGYTKGLCPQAEEFYERIITLPLFPSMSNRDALDVIAAVKKVVRYFKSR